jgi:hypothetical protein
MAPSQVCCDRQLGRKAGNSRENSHRPARIDPAATSAGGNFPGRIVTRHAKIFGIER